MQRKTVYSKMGTLRWAGPLGERNQPGCVLTVGGLRCLMPCPVFSELLFYMMYYEVTPQMIYCAGHSHPWGNLGLVYIGTTAIGWFLFKLE